jgi:hypothetical protein
MHKVFISYHHLNDQGYKENLVRFGEENQIFIDGSVDTGDISDDLPSQTIREIIRDDYLRDSTVTIVLVGTSTKGRKHIDWEIYSSMINGARNKRSGIIAITLPETNCTYFTTAHEGEKAIVYPSQQSWMTVDTRGEFERRYPYMPVRLIDNLLKREAKISVTNWDKLNVDTLRFLVEAAHADRLTCEYDLSTPMRRANAPL